MNQYLSQHILGVLILCRDFFYNINLHSMSIISPPVYIDGLVEERCISIANEQDYIFLPPTHGYILSLVSKLTENILF